MSLCDHTQRPEPEQQCHLPSCPQHEHPVLDLMQSTWRVGDWGQVGFINFNAKQAIVVSSLR